MQFETNFLYYCKPNSNFVLQIFYGGLAHLARAFDWQSKGGRFDPDILHKKRLFLLGNNLLCLNHFFNKNVLFD